MNFPVIVLICVILFFFFFIYDRGELSGRQQIVPWDFAQPGWWGWLETSSTTSPEKWTAQNWTIFQLQSWLITKQLNYDLNSVVEKSWLTRATTLLLSLHVKSGKQWFSPASPHPASRDNCSHHPFSLLKSLLAAPLQCQALGAKNSSSIFFWLHLGFLCCFLCFPGGPIHIKDLLASLCISSHPNSKGLVPCFLCRLPK